jgi:hypothetical protein
MFFLRQRHRPSGRRCGRGPERILRLGFVITTLIAGLAVPLRAQPPLPLQAALQKSADRSAAEMSSDERVKTLERERDDLKKRNADLEQRLRQLQATVDNLVHQALGEQSAPQAFGLPPSVGMVPRRSFGPFMTQFRPMFPPLNGMPDTVELAVAFSDALAEKEAAGPAVAAARQKAQSDHGASSSEADLATAQLLRADRKVRLLRNIIATARNVAADEAQRMRRLGAVHAVSTADVRNADARLKMFDEILAADPEAGTKTPGSPQPAEPK